MGLEAPAIGQCAGAFIAKRNTAPGGRLPLNTNGGGLSYMHSGMYGMYPLQENVRQMRGTRHRPDPGRQDLGLPRRRRHVRRLRLDYNVERATLVGRTYLTKDHQEDRVMRYLRVLCVAVLTLFPTAILASATEGLATKPSVNSVDATLDRLEAALKERGFIIFTRLDHAAAAQSLGLKMPRSTVLVFGNPRLGTPNFIQHPTYAIDLPLKALVWEDANGKVWVSYNNSEWSKVINRRHGVPTNPERLAQIDATLDSAADAATK
jgi:uncharacterized protein (DUF302 family)